MTLKKFAMMLFSALIFIATAQAHNVWLEQTTGAPTPTYVVKFGHDVTEFYPAHKLKAVQALDTNGQILPIIYKYQQGEATFSTNNALIVFLHFDNGIWAKLPSGKFVEKNQKEVPDAEFFLNPIKFGKAILVWNEYALKPHTMEFELVPQAIPEVGKPLPILVIYQGKPVKGVKVGTHEDKPFVLTDENGLALYTPVQGKNRVWAEFEEKTPNHPKYSTRSIEYLLTFEK